VKDDFDSPVVRRFISLMLSAWTGSEGAGYRIDPSPAGTAGLMVFEPFPGPGKRRCLVLLCRKTLPEKAIRDMAGSFDLVVAAERPWDAGLVPDSIEVIITYGICDAAALWLGKTLSNGRGA